MIGSEGSKDHLSVDGAFYIQFCFIGGAKQVAKIQSVVVFRPTQVLAENRVRLEHAQAGRRVLIMSSEPATVGQVSGGSIKVIR